MTPDTPGTAFTRLVGCELPIQLAPIGAAGREPRLALAVADAGGHAIYPGVFLTASELESELDEVGAHTRAFGVNFIAPMVERQCVEVAARCAPLVDFFYGDPDRELVEIVHAGGALASWQVGSLEEALAAVECGCDAVVAQGSEAGGRVRGSQPLLALVDQVAAGVDVPVVAAGGIATAADVAAAIGAGADAVRVGTRFVASQEADAHPAWKQALVEAAADESVLTSAFSVGVPDFPHRVLQRSLDAAAATPAETVGTIGAPDGSRRPMPRYGSELATRDFEGHVDAMPFYAGRSVGGVHAVLPAAQIVAELAMGLVEAPTH